MKCWLPDALTHISNTTVTWCRGIEVEDWRNKKCFPDPPKFVRSGNLDLCVWLGFVLVWVPAQLCRAAVWSAVVVNHDFVQNFPATAGTQRHRDGMNIKHCKNVFIAKLGAAVGIRSYRGNTITAGRDRDWDLGSCQPLVCSKLPAGCLLCSLQAAVVRSHRMGRALQHCSGVLVRRLGGAPLHAASAHHLQHHCRLLHALLSPCPGLPGQGWIYWQCRGRYIDCRLLHALLSPCPRWWQVAAPAVSTPPPHRQSWPGARSVHISVMLLAVSRYI